MVLVTLIALVVPYCCSRRCREARRWLLSESEIVRLAEALAAELSRTTCWELVCIGIVRSSFLLGAYARTARLKERSI
jgi:hypothetical protein